MMRDRALAAALLAAALAGCGRPMESVGPALSVGEASASYRLTAVAAQPLPAVAYFGVDVATRATAGTLTLAADHSYALAVDYAEHFASGNRDRSFSQQETGRWSAGAAGVQLEPQGGGAHTATVSADTLTVTLTVSDASPPERATKPYTFLRVR